MNIKIIAPCEKLILKSDFLVCELHFNGYFSGHKIKKIRGKILNDTNCMIRDKTYLIEAEVIKIVKSCLYVEINNFQDIDDLIPEL